MFLSVFNWSISTNDIYFDKYCILDVIKKIEL